MAVSIQYSNSKKTKEISYPSTQRENIDTVHYPNHSVGIKKHNCIFKHEGDRNMCNLGCNAFRPVTRRNITDMPNNQTYDPGCDHVSKSLDKCADKNCPNLKTKLFSGTPHTAYANFGQEFLDAKYYETPCIENGIKKCKPECYTNRKIDRAKFAFKEHIARMQYAKQHCGAHCEGTNRITYCDGYTETDPCVLMQQYPNKYSCESDLYKTPHSYAPIVPAIEATRSFGTCTLCKSISCKKPSCSIGTNTIYKESLHSGPPSSLKQYPSNIPTAWRRQDHNTSASGGGCCPTTCPIQRLVNMGKQINTNTTTQQGLTSETQSTLTQTVEKNAMINVSPSQAKENLQCSELCPVLYPLQCTKEINCEMLRTGHTYCKDVPVFDTNTHLSTKLEDIQRKYQSMRQTEDDISKESTNTPHEKRTSTAETVDYEPYSNILNNIANNDSHKSRCSNGKETDSMQSNNSNKFVTSKLKQKNKMDRQRPVENIETQSDVDCNNKKSLGDSIDSVISKTASRYSPENEPSTSELESDENSQLEIVHERKSKKVKRKFNKKTNFDELTLDQLYELHKLIAQYSNRSIIVLEVVDEYIKGLKTISEQSQQKVSGEFEKNDEKGHGQTSKLEADSQSTKATNAAQIVEAISAYIDNISPGINPTEYLANISIAHGFQASDLNKIVGMLYEKIKDVAFVSAQDSSLSKQKSMKDEIRSEPIPNLETQKIVKKLQMMEDGELADGTRARILRKQSGGSKTNRKVCANRKGLKHTFKDLDERVHESLLKFSNENIGNVEDHEYLQFCLRITEDIIRNDLYTNGQMRRVFKSHLEANRGRLDTQRMVDKINSLCMELNIPFNETFPFENITPISNCDTNVDTNYICYCNEENGTLEAKQICMCATDYYRNIVNEEQISTIKGVTRCQCGTEFCVEHNCPGEKGYIEGEFEHLVGPDFDFANEGLLQSVIYSETHCLGPVNKEGECKCATLEMVSNTIRSTSSATTGYISSINEGNGAIRRSMKRGMVNREEKNSIGGTRNKGKFMTSLRFRGVNRMDGASTASNSYANTNEDSAPVRIKTPVTALRTQFGSANTENNFVVVECPVLVPTGDLIEMNNAIETAEVQNSAGGEVQLKLNRFPIEVKKQPEQSTGTNVMAQLREDMNQVVYANEINETLTDPLAVPACNDCSCNADCNEINGNQNAANVPLLKQNNLPKAFATSGLKSRLEELTAITLAISNNNMQSMLEKHPTYKQMESCTLCHFNNNFTKPVESTSVFYPSKALNGVYSKCLFQQNNLLLGDEYVMFNPYSVRPETILHFFPTACTQVASDDFMKDSKSSITSAISSVTGIVDNIIKASKDSSRNSNARKLSLVPPENLVKAIKNEIYKVDENNQLSSQKLLMSKNSMDNHKTLSSAESSKTTQESYKTKMAIFPGREEIEYHLPLVEEEEITTLNDLNAFEKSRSEEEERKDDVEEEREDDVEEEEREYDVEEEERKDDAEEERNKDVEEERKYDVKQEDYAETMNNSGDITVISFGKHDKLFESGSTMGTHIHDFNVNENANIDSAQTLEKGTKNSRPIINTRSDSSSTNSNTTSVNYNKWMEKLDIVPSIKMTSSLKGSFDKALSDTDKFRGIHNANDDGSLIKGMMNHLRNGQLKADDDITSQHNEPSTSNNISKYNSKRN